jgi:hypothetical protein
VKCVFQIVDVIVELVEMTQDLLRIHTALDNYWELDYLLEVVSTHRQNFLWFASIRYRDCASGVK